MQQEPQTQEQIGTLERLALILVPVLLTALVIVDAAHRAIG